MQIRAASRTFLPEGESGTLVRARSLTFLPERAREMRTRAIPRMLPEGDGENSPGWSAAKPWEGMPFVAPPSRRDGRSSTPNIPWVVFDAMLVQESDKLRLEIAPAMMLLLTGDVCQRALHLGPSNRECPITLLPLKVFHRAGLVHPTTRHALDFSHCVGYRRRRWQRQQKMDMVLNSAYAKRLHLVLARDAAHIGPQPLLNFRNDSLAPLLGGEDAMKQRATIGV